MATLFLSIERVNASRDSSIPILLVVLVANEKWFEGLTMINLSLGTWNSKSRRRLGWYWKGDEGEGEGLELLY
jgi:hypothetical protein